MPNAFPTLREPSVNPEQFVTFWRRAYSADPTEYDDNIRLSGSLSEKNLRKLMEWKAGKRFAGEARAWSERVGVRDINAQRQGGNSLSDETLRALFSKVRSMGSMAKGGGGALIWPLFICHLADPDGTPIYDVNTWHAALHLTGEWRKKYASQKPSKFSTYLEWYRPWFADIVDGAPFSAQHLDQALMAFGQFTATRWWSLLESTQAGGRASTKRDS